MEDPDISGADTAEFQPIQLVRPRAVDLELDEIRKRSAMLFLKGMLEPPTKTRILRVMAFSLLWAAAIFKMIILSPLLFIVGVTILGISERRERLRMFEILVSQQEEIMRQSDLIVELADPALLPPSIPNPPKE